jgi:hypothetical protein
MPRTGGGNVPAFTHLHRVDGEMRNNAHTSPCVNGLLMYNPPTVSSCDVRDSSFDNWFAGIVLLKNYPAGSTPTKVKRAVLTWMVENGTLGEEYPYQLFACTREEGNKKTPQFALPAGE